MTTAQNEEQSKELFNQVNRVVTLVVVVIMLAQWVFRDVIDHRAIQQKIDASTESLKKHIDEAVEKIVKENMRNKEQWEEGLKAIGSR